MKFLIQKRCIAKRRNRLFLGRFETVRFAVRLTGTSNVPTLHPVLDATRGLEGSSPSPRGSEEVTKG